MWVASLLPRALAGCSFGYHCSGLDLYRIARDSIALVSLLEKLFHLEKLSLMETRITRYDVNDLFMRSSSAGLLAVSPIGTHFWW